MLVVISDLHFEEETSDQIPGRGDSPGVSFVRNLPPEAFERFFNELATRALRDRARHIDLVLAGDIFDLHRTALWFEDGSSLRPYVPCDAVDPALEQKLLGIIEAIAAEPRVAGSLRAIRRAAAGRYLDLGTGKQQAFPVPTSIHFIPGNHDRLIDATPRLRSKARELLGLPPGDEPFPHVIRMETEETLIRHGHEYDRYNFSRDLGGKRRWREPTAADYAAPAFGDFVTVEIASRLPVLFQEIHGDARIVRTQALRRLYVRLLEFDDLRPQMALLEFLLASRTGETPGRMWKRVEPVFKRLLDDVHDHPFLRAWLDRLEKRWRPDAIDAVQAALDLQVWKAGLPLKLIRSLIRLRHAGGGGVTAEDVAAREPAVRHGEVRFVVAGHTHTPRVSLLVADTAERYYVDTGTWRNRIPANAAMTSFGRLKALTWVAIYGPDEDPGRTHPETPSISFDDWSGFTQRWPVEMMDGHGR